MSPQATRLDAESRRSRPSLRRDCPPLKMRLGREYARWHWWPGVSARRCSIGPSTGGRGEGMRRLRLAAVLGLCAGVVLAPGAGPATGGDEPRPRDTLRDRARADHRWSGGLARAVCRVSVGHAGDRRDRGGLARGGERTGRPRGRDRLRGGPRRTRTSPRIWTSRRRARSSSRTRRPRSRSRSRTATARTRRRSRTGTATARTSPRRSPRP